MTMAIRLPKLPPELQAAKETLVSALRDAFPTPDVRRSQAIVYSGALVFGAIAGWFFVASGLIVPSDGRFWRAALMIISVLSGFMIATMVFTGKIDAAKSLSLAELRDVASKVNYLLLYQVGTLANHLICLSLMLLVPSAAAKSALLGSVMAVICLGFLFVSLARSLLIPIQIIELHRFTHAALLRDKREEVKADRDL